MKEPALLTRLMHKISTGIRE